MVSVEAVDAIVARVGSYAGWDIVKVRIEGSSTVAVLCSSTRRDGYYNLYYDTMNCRELNGRVSALGLTPEQLIAVLA